MNKDGRKRQISGITNNNAAQAIRPSKRGRTPLRASSEIFTSFNQG
jgi:hypothetical protein